MLLTTWACEREVMPSKDEHNLPVVSFSTDEKYLWSPDSGLYVMGRDEEVPNSMYKWEFPAKVKLKIDGETQFSDTVGFRIKGTSTRDNNMKSLGLYWRSEYGKSKLNHQVFGESDLGTYKRLLLRNLANDPLQTYIKDAAIMRMFRGHAKVDYQEYEPCVLYINKEYWGLYGLREMITPHHFEFHYGVNNETVDMLKGAEWNPVADDGSTEDFIRDVVEFVKENPLVADSNYVAIKEVIDVESYMDYIIINTYIGKYDWPNRNGKWWRDKTSADYNKWRWVAYDFDLGFLLTNAKNIFMGDLYGESFGMMGSTEGFFLFNHLITNKEFRAQFLERYLYFIDVVFAKQRVEDIVMSTYDEIKDEYQYHQSRWNSPGKITLDIKAKGMVMFNNGRREFMRDIIKELQDED